jgi:SPP1 family predicted phage head-tail adaptor
MVALDRQVWFDRPAGTLDDAGAATDDFVPHAEVWAEIRDLQPSRSESLRQGLVQGQQQSRVRIRWRDDIDASMRIRDGARTLQIVGGPAELGRRQYLELLCEAYTTSGAAA